MRQQYVLEQRTHQTDGKLGTTARKQHTKRIQFVMRARGSDLVVEKSAIEIAS
jgi:hypothetical protein